MALACSLVEAVHSAADASSYAFASHTFTAGRLYIVCAASSVASAPNVTVSSITGATASFTQIISSLNSNTVRQCDAWRYAPGSTVTETLTVAFSAGSTSGDIILLEITGHDTSGTNGSGAIVQSLAAGGTSGTTGLVTLSAFASANNRAVGFFAHRAQEVSAPGANFTELDDGSHATPAMGYETEFSTTNDNTVDATWTTSSGWAGVAFEVAIAGLSAITGTLSKTLSNDTIAASGTPIITGTFSKTNTNDTSAASGTPVITGALSKTLSNVACTAAGTPVTQVTVAENVRGQQGLGVYPAHYHTAPQRTKKKAKAKARKANDEQNEPFSSPKIYAKNVNLLQALINNRKEPQPLTKNKNKHAIMLLLSH